MALTKAIKDQLMNCIITSTVCQEDDEDAWLKARTKGIGGSDVGAICGVSPFSSAKQVYFSKTGQYQDSFAPNDAAKDRMHFGHVLEPVVADEYALRTGCKLIDINCTVQHKDHPWALANIDRLMVEEIEQEDGSVVIKPIGILECKTTGEYMDDEWSNGEILMSYLYQLNWYLWILGLERGAFACLVGGNKFYYYDVYRNDELLNEVMIPQARDFWFNNVLKLVEPEMQATDDVVIKELYMDCVKGSEIQLLEDVENDLVATIVTCKKKVKELTDIQKAAENRIKDRLKNAEIAYTKDYTVKWSPQSTRRIDTDLFKTQYPAIYDAVCKSTVSRVMRIKGGA